MKDRAIGQQAIFESRRLPITISLTLGQGDGFTSSFAIGGMPFELLHRS